MMNDDDRPGFGLVYREEQEKRHGVCYAWEAA